MIEVLHFSVHEVLNEERFDSRESFRLHLKNMSKKNAGMIEHCFELESNTSCVASNVKLSSDEFTKEW